MSHNFAVFAGCLALSCGGSVASHPDAGDGGADTSTMMVDATMPVDGTVLDGAAPDVSLSHDTSTTTAPDGYFPDARCSPGNCPNGCCNSEGFCVDPPTNEFCGGHGEVCFSCGAGQCEVESCSTMVNNCGPSNCGGCCVGTGMTSLCISGTFSIMCGAGGTECTACAPGEACRAVGFDAGGYCQANSGGCTPDNCTGCCVGDVCAQGDQSVACGFGGEACNTCPNGWACGAGVCICEAVMFDAGNCNTDAGGD